MLKVLAAAAALALGTSAVMAQTFPDRAINLMVASPAGGSTDVGARIVSSIAEKLIGQPVVVVNKAGAGGQVGWTELTRQKPDGYNIGFVILPGTNTTYLDPARQAIYTNESFTPIINHVLDPGVIWVAASSPFKTLQDVFDAAKAKPGELRASTTGLLSDDHLAILMVEEAVPNVKFRLVHLLGSAAQMKETLGGNIDVSFDNVGSIVKQVQAGQVRALAILDTERSKFLPDVPTMKELGFPEVVSSSTRGIAGPKGMKPEVIAKLADTFEKAMQDPDHQRRMDEVGLAVKPMRGADYQKYFDDLHAKSKKYVEWAKVRQDK
jgi:tripartite-type tricarboxylate transporter receptor subunit TctC